MIAIVRAVVGSLCFKFLMMITVNERYQSKNQFYSLLRSAHTSHLHPNSVEACLLNLTFSATSKRCNPTMNAYLSLQIRQF